MYSDTQTYSQTVETTTTTGVFGQGPTPTVRTLPPKIERTTLPPQYKTVTLPAKVVKVNLPPVGPVGGEVTTTTTTSLPQEFNF